MSQTRKTPAVRLIPATSILIVMTAENITGVRITGFRSIEQAYIQLDSINLMIGSNGSGKSTILGIFELLRAATKGELQKFIAENGGAEVLFRYGTGKTKMITLRAEFGDSFYELTLRPGEENTVHIANEQLSLVSNEVTHLLTSENTRETGILTGLPDNPACRSFHLDVQTWAVYRFSNQCETPSEAYLAAFLHRMQEESPAHYEKITDTIRLIFPQFRDFFFTLQNGTHTIRWTDRSSGSYEFPLRVLSGGTARFIALSVLLLQPRPPKLLLIDEPELGLHPFAIAVIADMIKFASRTTQLIISTQSIQLLNEFGPEPEENGSKILIVENRNGATTITTPTPEMLAGWMEEYSIGDLWQMNILGGNP